MRIKAKMNTDQQHTRLHRMADQRVKEIRQRFSDAIMSNPFFAARCRGVERNLIPPNPPPTPPTPLNPRQPQLPPTPNSVNPLPNPPPDPSMRDPPTESASLEMREELAEEVSCPSAGAANGRSGRR
ncbi:fibronectin-binding protein B-like [Penaeus vannamei]|uniref:fibronectin-binding protein B-like n=1 Tax=Penaeus vannamei TaxID=6689 RepID=UPI00387F5796